MKERQEVSKELGYGIQYRPTSGDQDSCIT